MSATTKRALLPMEREGRMVMAKAAAEFAVQCLHHVHKGVIDCGDKIVVFFNGKWPDLPERVKQFLLESGINEEVEYSHDSSGDSWGLSPPTIGDTPLILSD